MFAVVVTDSPAAAVVVPSSVLFIDYYIFVMVIICKNIYTRQSVVNL